MRHTGDMAPSNDELQPIRDALDAAQGLSADEALPLLREASDALTALLDESMARAVLEGQNSLRSAGARAGLSENAVGPRLARTRLLGAYAGETGRVTAAGVERARYDAESDALIAADAPPPPMRFKPRRTTR